MKIFADSSAPKGRHMPAQGNALGSAWKNFPALKGRDNGRAARWVAPSATVFKNKE